MAQKKRRNTVRNKKTSKKKNSISVKMTAWLCVVVIGACFVILVMNQNADRTPAVPEKTESAVKQPAASVQETAVQEEKVPAVQQPAEEAPQQVPAAQSEKPSILAAVPVEKQPSAATPAVQPAEKKTSSFSAPVHRKNAEKNAAVKTPVQPRKSIDFAEKKCAPLKPEKSAGVLPDLPQAVNHAKLVFVFDDAGQNISQLEKYVSLPFPVTVAVLPKLPHSRKCADLVRSSGNEVMLHQPMQALNRNVNPGPGAVLPDMTSSQIMQLVKENIAELGPVAGVNNHEGSLISEDEVKIGAVMQAARQSGAFFLDSRTTAQTRVPQASMELGIPYYERNVFLDNNRKRDEIIKEIVHGLGLANAQGTVIMIGHVWSADVLPNILIELYPALKAKGYVFTTVSRSGAVRHP